MSAFMHVCANKFFLWKNIGGEHDLLHKEAHIPQKKIDKLLVKIAL